MKILNVGSFRKESLALSKTPLRSSSANQHLTPHKRSNNLIYDTTKNPDNIKYLIVSTVIFRTSS